jgi:DNA polymerase III epsilon subunit-like protein
MLSDNCLKSTNRYVALDVETTGLSPKNGDRVIENGWRAKTRVEQLIEEAVRQ